jgi:hypothetical protein
LDFVPRPDQADLYAWIMMKMAGGEAPRPADDDFVFVFFAFSTSSNWARNFRCEKRCRVENPNLPQWLRAFSQATKKPVFLAEIDETKLKIQRLKERARIQKTGTRRSGNQFSTFRLRAQKNSVNYPIRLRGPRYSDEGE